MFNFVPSGGSRAGGISGNGTCRITESQFQSYSSRSSWSKRVTTTRKWDPGDKGMKYSWSHPSNVAKWWSSKVSVLSGLSRYMLCIRQGKPFAGKNQHTCLPNQHINSGSSTTTRDGARLIWAARFSPHKSSRSSGDGRALTQHHRNARLTLSSFSLNQRSHNKKELRAYIDNSSVEIQLGC